MNWVPRFIFSSLLVICEEARPPNLILFFSDDLGWGDVGCNWNETVYTPNIDALASSGLRLTDFHAGASVCTPSRAALLTSRLGLRTGVTDNFSPYSVAGLPLNETILPEVLKTVGYTTGMIGKWHLGLNGSFHPSLRGFDSYLGIPYSNDMGCLDYPAHNLPMCPLCEESARVNSGICESTATGTGPTAIAFCDSSLAVPLFVNQTIIQQPVDLSALSDRYAETAGTFIRRSARQPFLLYMAFTHVHVPLTTAHPRDGEDAFSAALSEMDATVGAVMRTVRELGLEEDTLVWFTADNGPWEVKCNLSGSAGPFTGSWQRGHGGGSASKDTVFEGGHRVPSIVSWKGHIQPSRVSSSLTSALDIMPTFVTLAGALMPPDRMFDGIDLTPLLVNNREMAHQTLIHPVGTCIPGHIGDVGAVRVNNYKGIYFTGGKLDCQRNQPPPAKHDPPLIFDLANDPAESTPLTSDYPRYTDILKEIQEARLSFILSVQRDNSSTADYSKNVKARPCCDYSSSVCQCPWNIVQPTRIH